MVVVVQRRYCLVEDEELKDLLVGFFICKRCRNLLAFGLQQIIGVAMREHYLQQWRIIAHMGVDKRQGKLLICAHLLVGVAL